MHHYSMPVVEHKERAKQILKFAQVPFYAIFNPTGTLLYSGRKLDRTILAAAMAAQHQQIAPPSILNAISTTGLPPELSTLLETVQTDRMTEERMFSPSVKSAPMTGSNEKEAPYYLANSLDSPSNVFAIDDLDF